MEALEIGHRLGNARFREAGDYFYRDLVESQIRYLKAASTTQGGASWRLALLGAAIMACGVAAPILAQAGAPSLVVVGALAAIVTPALLSGLKSWLDAAASREREKLHRATLRMLTDVAGRKRELDTAIESDDLDGALAYADLVIAAQKTDVDRFLSIMQGAFQPDEPALPPGGGRR